MTANAITVGKELTLFTWPNCWDCVCMNNEMAYLHPIVQCYFSSLISYSKFLSPINVYLKRLLQVIIIHPHIH